jgi:hypothetical protein
VIGVIFAMGVGLLSERLSLVRPKPTYTLFLFTQSNLRHRPIEHEAYRAENGINYIGAA